VLPSKKQRFKRQKARRNSGKE